MAAKYFPVRVQMTIRGLMFNAIIAHVRADSFASAHKEMVRQTPPVRRFLRQQFGDIGENICLEVSASFWPADDGPIGILWAYAPLCEFMEELTKAKEKLA